MFHDPFGAPSLTTARSSYRPAVEALESRVVAAGISPAVFLGAQEVLGAFHDLVSLEQHPTMAAARAVLVNESREGEQHLLAHEVDQIITAQGVDDTPFQQLDDLFHALNAQAVDLAQRVLARG